MCNPASFPYVCLCPSCIWKCAYLCTSAIVTVLIDLLSLHLCACLHVRVWVFVASLAVFDIYTVIDVQSALLCHTYCIFFHLTRRSTLLTESWKVQSRQEKCLNSEQLFPQTDSMDVWIETSVYVFISLWVSSFTPGGVCEEKGCLMPTCSRCDKVLMISCCCVIFP